MLMLSVSISPAPSAEWYAKESSHGPRGKFVKVRDGISTSVCSERYQSGARLLEQILRETQNRSECDRDWFLVKQSA